MQHLGHTYTKKWFFIYLNILNFIYLKFKFEGHFVSSFAKSGNPTHVGK